MLVSNSLLLLASVSPIAAEQPALISRQASMDTADLLKEGADSMMEAPAPPMMLLNKEAQRFVSTYLKHEKEMLVKVKARSKSYFSIMDQVFTKYDLPVELKYLAVVESELKSTALSGVGARGPWQLMPATARILGLKVHGKYDERTHAWKSTNAAAKYLKDLYTQFGDWLLVLAAYNSGPGPVYKAIKRSGSRNFWKLQSFLPAETRGHVKKFIGVHYYFEGKAGETTSTKAELADHQKAMDEFLALQGNDHKTTPIDDATAGGNEPGPDKAILKINSNSELLLTKEK